MGWSPKSRSRITDLVFLDVQMPVCDGFCVIEQVGAERMPPVVFVTAYDEHAVEAFELDVADYLLKPVRESRLADAVRRVLESGTPPTDEPEDAIAVELGGVTKFVRRSEVRYVEAQGDYTRLHTATGKPLIRVPLATLEEEWRPAGFVRIHRSHLVALAHVSEVRSDGGRVTVVVDGEELTVSRRHTRELGDLLVRRARPGGGARS